MKSRLVLMVFFIAGISGCTQIGNFARRDADRSAYAVIGQKQRDALGDASPFALEPKQHQIMREVELNARRLDVADDTFTTPTFTLSLADTLAIAIANNREYQNERERLFRQALDVTGIRWDYGTIFDVSGTAEHTRAHREDVLNGGTTIEKFGGRSLAASMKRQLATGANISLAYTHQFVHLFSNGVSPGANNGLALNIVQPLLRGAGSLVALEGLRQSERDMVYAVRNFAFFEQGFLINVVDRYFDVLRSMDRMSNVQSNLKSTKGNSDLLDIQVRHRTRSQLDADQARQKVLDAQALVLDAQSAYQSQLDQFKIFLGIDPSLDVGPDREELNALKERGMIRPDLTLAEAIETGLRERLDFQNFRDRTEDARRHVEIALREFLPTLDASYDLQYIGQRGHGFGLDRELNAQTRGLDLGLPLDWTPRRNNYRNRMLDFDVAVRAQTQQHDFLIAEVREAWRQLDRLRQRVSIAQESVRLAERRVEGTQMMLASGQVTAREMSDTQDELLNAQNALTSVLIDYTLTRLQFWRAIGRLSITDALPNK